MPIFKGKKYVQVAEHYIPYILYASKAVEADLDAFENLDTLKPFPGGIQIRRSALAKVFRAGPGRGYLESDGFNVILGKNSIQVGCSKFSGEQFQLIRTWALARRRKA